jgi:hypothetical protein
MSRLLYLLDPPIRQYSNLAEWCERVASVGVVDKQKEDQGMQTSECERECVECGIFCDGARLGELALSITDISYRFYMYIHACRA